VLITANQLRLLDAHPCHLSRSGAVDWSALLRLMCAASARGQDPFSEAVRVQERLFTTKPIFLGVEASLKNPSAPCGLKTDAERARHVRRLVREMLNSQGEWEPLPAFAEVPIRDVRICGPKPAKEATGETPGPGLATRPVLSEPAAIEKVGHGTLVIIAENEHGKTYGRAVTVAEKLHDDRVLMAKWVRRLTNWNGRQASMQAWQEKILPLLRTRLEAQRTPIVCVVGQAHKFIAHLSLADLTLRVPMDRHGVALWRPVEREVLPYDCAQCDLVETCKQLPTATGTALLWRRLGLVDAAGQPTMRGQVVSCFSQGYGLAVAAALEDESYPLDELVYDVANLDAGFRFCGDDNRWGGRLAIVCHERYGLQSIPGYLENGVPPKYGLGAEQIVASVHKNPLNKHGWVTDLLGPGDIDRVIIEWRSFLRQIAHAPELAWPRWRALQAMARGILNETQSPTLTDLPPLEFHQTKRVDHRLILRRH
jgi:hypothetical protein